MSELDELRIEVSGLKDLFLRRLLEDKTKTAQFELLHEQLRGAQDIVNSRIFEPLFTELLFAVDRLQAAGQANELAASVSDELLDILGHYSLTAVPAVGLCDARVHEVVEAVAQGADSVVGQILSVRRPGYVLGERLLRPAQVVVAVAALPATA